jgi:hypothetical protein
MAGNTSVRGATVTSRVLALLGAFDARHRELSLSDLARRSGVPLATAHRLAAELAEWGALDKTGEGKYVVGRRLWDRRRNARTRAVPVRVVSGMPGGPGQARVYRRRRGRGHWRVRDPATHQATGGQYAGLAGCALVIDGGIYQHEFMAATVVDALMRVQLDADVPVFSAVLTPHHFHEHEEHEPVVEKHAEAPGGDRTLLGRLFHLPRASLCVAANQRPLSATLRPRGDDIKYSL